MAQDLFYQVLAGQKIVTANMTNNDNKWEEKKFKLEQVIELLRFALSSDDEEIIKSTVESTIEIIEEIVK